MADESDIWADWGADGSSRPRSPKKPKSPKRPRTPKTPTSPAEHQPEPIDREAVLRKELEGVRSINESIEGMIGTLERAGGNMEVRMPQNEMQLGMPVSLVLTVACRLSSRR